MTNADKPSQRILKGKRPREILRHTLEYNIKLNNKEIGKEDMD
jgi:hypothetical protein